MREDVKHRKRKKERKKERERRNVKFIQGPKNNCDFELKFNAMNKWSLKLAVFDDTYLESHFYWGLWVNEM